jgi:uncharacterized protein
MLYQRISNERQKAFIEKDTVKHLLLTTVFSDIQKLQKEKVIVTDSHIEEIIQKFVKGLKENIKLGKKINSSQIEQYEKELEILQEYLPKQLTEEELNVIVKNFYEAGKRNTGLIMKELKENYSGKYDGKKASTIAKDICN